MHGQAAVLNGGTLDAWYAPAIAVSGRTRAQIDACVRDPRDPAAIQRDIDSAVAADAHNTPTFFVNGRRVTDRSLGGLEVAIRAAAATLTA
jgi:protein-disulfide isomerase